MQSVANAGSPAYQGTTGKLLVGLSGGNGLVIPDFVRLAPFRAGVVRWIDDFHNIKLTEFPLRLVSDDRGTRERKTLGIHRRIIMIKSFYITFLCVVIISCNKNDDDSCAGVLPEEPVITFTIIDENGVNLLGEKNIFKHSQITLTRDDQSIDLFFYEEANRTFFDVPYPQMEDEVSYFLKLTANDFDILSVDWRPVDTDCGSFSSIDDFFYNDMNIQVGDTDFFYEIVKPQ